MVRYLHIKKRTIYFVFIFIIRVIWYDICISICITYIYTSIYDTLRLEINTQRFVSNLRAPRSTTPTTLHSTRNHTRLHTQTQNSGHQITLRQQPESPRALDSMHLKLDLL